MTLSTVVFDTGAVAVPAGVKRFLDRARERTRRLLARSGGRPLAAFVPSDYEDVYCAMRALRDSDLLAGDRFCEWGAGAGVVTLLAQRIGFCACGIEIEPELVELARGLAGDFSLDAEFACGTFLPASGQDAADAVREFEWLEPGGADGYDALGRDPDEFDLVFSYPWPGEEDVVFDLFDRFAGRGTVLLTYHGREGLRAQRRL